MLTVKEPKSESELLLVEHSIVRLARVVADSKEFVIINSNFNFVQFIKEVKVRAKVVMVMFERPEFRNFMKGLLKNSAIMSTLKYSILNYQLLFKSVKKYH